MNTKKKTPHRMCIACRQMKDKKELIRLVKSKEDNTLNIDTTGKMHGRGAYLCLDENCLEQAIKSKVIFRTFGVHLSDEQIDAIKLQIARKGLNLVK